jgi:hypothetical protein
MRAGITATGQVSAKVFQLVVNDSTDLIGQIESSQVGALTACG